MLAIWFQERLIDAIEKYVDAHIPKQTQEPERRECKCVYESDCHGIEMIKSPSGKEWAIGGTATQDRWKFCPWCGGLTPMVEKEPERKEEYWTCPHCKSTDCWFDRSITVHSDGSEEGMCYRCNRCGKREDEPVEKPAKKELSNGSPHDRQRKIKAKDELAELLRESSLKYQQSISSGGCQYMSKEESKRVADECRKYIKEKYGIEDKKD